MSVISHNTSTWSPIVTISIIYQYIIITHTPTYMRDAHRHTLHTQRHTHTHNRDTHTTDTHTTDTQTKTQTQTQTHIHTREYTYYAYIYTVPFRY